MFVRNIIFSWYLTIGIFINTNNLMYLLFGGVAATFSVLSRSAWSYRTITLYAKSKNNPAKLQEGVFKQKGIIAKIGSVAGSATWFTRFLFQEIIGIFSITSVSRLFGVFIEIPYAKFLFNEAADRGI